LKPDDLDFLTSLRPTIDLKGLVLCAHGSPTDRDEYVRTTTRMNEILSSAATRICAVGHTHVQYAFDGTKRVTGASDEIQLDAGGRMLVNPGSVGQPRDEDNRAAYAILDLEEGLLALKRVEYDIETTVQKIYGLGLPGVFAERIRRGR
jgi:diadenosine tetraphosphatase ApaH/serine/threonine PP2A family protein phosphatase